MAKNATYNNESASTKFSLFFTTKDLHLRVSFDIIKFSDSNTCEQIFNKNILDIFVNMQIT